MPDSNQHWGEDAFADVRQAFSMHWPNLHEEALRSIEEQVETLTGRNQFLSTEQIRADVAEAALTELKEQLQAAEREIGVLTFAAENRWKRMEEAEEQLDTLRVALEQIAAYLPEDAKHGAQTRARRALNDVSFPASSPVSAPVAEHLTPSEPGQGSRLGRTSSGDERNSPASSQPERGGGCADRDPASSPESA